MTTRYINEQGEPMAFSEVKGEIDVRNYEELCVFLGDFRKPITSGDGKIYNADIGKAVWANIVCRKKPVAHQNSFDSESVYQLIAELGFNGDFPAMLYLYDRLNISESKYLAICKDNTDDRSAIFRWAREVFSHVSKINAVHGNGNVNVFQYVSMSDDVDIASDNQYVTPEKNIQGILELFSELAANKGKVGENDETGG